MGEPLYVSTETLAAQFIGSPRLAATVDPVHRTDLNVGTTQAGALMLDWLSHPIAVE